MSWLLRAMVLVLALPGKSCVTFDKMLHLSESVSFFVKWKQCGLHHRVAVGSQIR